MRLSAQRACHFDVNTYSVLPWRPNILSMSQSPYTNEHLSRLAKGLVFALVAILLAISSAMAAPKSKLWLRWEAHDPTSQIVIDHGSWSRLLSVYTHPAEDGVTRFDYAGLAGADRPALDAYIAQLAGTPVGLLNRDEQLAYWINFYNALTVQVVLDHYPVSSILKINVSPGFFAIGPWGKKLVTVESEALSLDDIEHRILRPIWQDPRIHYGVNCASIGCPNLLPVAYTSATVDRLLTENAIAYVNHPRGVYFQGGALWVSNIYDWFQEDFGNSETGVLAHLREFAAPDLKARLRLVLDIGGYDYDWSLNAATDEATR